MVNSLTTASAALRDKPADLIILTPRVVDAPAHELGQRVRENLPAGQKLLFYTGKESTPMNGDVTAWLTEMAIPLIDSPAQLVDETSRRLARPLDKLTEPCRKMIYEQSDPAKVLAGKKVLIVDDDIRNIFALTSVLERYDMVTVPAETGRDAINLLQAAPDFDIVLMDIMMPEMDGIDTMRAIRQISRFENLPIIAVTAKAMKGDREKCIEAGAWDYLSKPVDPEHVLSVLRAWLTA
jgi:CheY-like chemotaxis protein